MEIKLEKIVNYRKPYMGKDGKERPSTQLYLVIPLPNDGEKRIAIKPAFGDKRPSDYTYLEMVAKVVTLRPEEDKPQPANTDKK